MGKTEGVGFGKGKREEGRGAGREGERCRGAGLMNTMLINS